MDLHLDAPNDGCTFVLEDGRYASTISSLVVSTDPDTRMSVVNVQGRRIHINEQDAHALIGAGAKDERFNVVVDDPSNRH